jgi:hypothetical protein
MQFVQDEFLLLSRGGRVGPGTHVTGAPSPLGINVALPRGGAPLAAFSLLLRPSLSCATRACLPAGVPRWVAL